MQRSIEPIAVRAADEACVVVGHLHSQDCLADIGAGLHELDYQGNIGLVVFGQIERQQQTHGVLGGVERRHCGLKVPLNALLGEFNGIVEPVDQTALYLGVILNGFAQLVVGGFFSCVVICINRPRQCFERIAASAQLLGKKRLGQAIDVVEKDMVDVALERPVAVKE